MDNPTMLTQVPSNFHFLSVCNYLISFGMIFYNQDLITLDERNHSVSVLNIMFEYFHNSTNESETKFQLLQKVLKGSDLYGGGKNDTLDMIYVNQTYQYIISKALFSHVGYIDGYLAGIINRADNVNYSVFKKMVFQDLSENYTIMDYCSSGSKSIKLTPMAVKKVFHNHILPMFPEPEEDISIIDVNYMYAMVGLKIVRSLGGDTSNSSFQDYIMISRELDFSEEYKNDTYQMVIALFSTPALLFYAYKEKEVFRENYQILQSNDKLWLKIYENLFSYINSTMNQNINEIFAKNVFWQLDKEKENLKTRTFLAESIMRKCCGYDVNQGEFLRYVKQYMTSPAASQFQHRVGSCLCYLPNLNDVYEEQFTKVLKAYNGVQKYLIKKALDTGNLLEIMNSKSTVKLAAAAYLPSLCIISEYDVSSCPFQQPTINSDIYLLFAIIDKNSETEYYALREEKNGLTLLVKSHFPAAFGNKVANDETLEMKVDKYKILKNPNEHYTAFIQTVADKKTDEFIKALKEYYYDPTVGEKIFKFLQSLVPFYTCIQEIKSGNVQGAMFSCSLDVLSLIPIVGFSVKYSAKLTTSLVIQMSERYIAKTLSRTGITMSLSQMSEIIAKTVSKEILTKSLLQDFCIATIRTVDPGLEFLYHISKHGLKFFNKTYQRMFSSLLHSSKSGKLMMTLRSVLDNIKIKLPADHTGLVPKLLDRQNNYLLFRYFHPGGVHYSGPTCVSPLRTVNHVSSFVRRTRTKTIAELRTVSGDSFPTPVIRVKSPVDSISYRPYNPDTGEISDLKLEMGKNDLLRRANYLIMGVGQWNDMKITRNYQVFPVRVEFTKKPETTDLHANVVSENQNLPSTVDSHAPESASGKGGPHSDDIPSTSKGLSKTLMPRNDYTAIFGEDTYANYFSSLQKFKEKGLSVIKDDKQTLETLREGAERISVYQTMNIPGKSPTDLWFTQTLTRRHFVNILSKLKGKEFSFNDITLLTDISPKEIALKKKSQMHVKTEIRYHIKFHSPIGLVDLASFHDSFKNQFLVFPELTFEVVDTKFFNSNEFLVLELKPKSIGKQEWLKVRRREEILLESREKVQLERAKKIENAAFEISLKIPLHKFSEVENALKRYILKIDDTVSDVPTYDTLAQDVLSGSTLSEIQDKYKNWEITNGIYIDDVLFSRELYQVDNLQSAEKQIQQMFDGNQKLEVKAVFDNYWSYPDIRHNVRFEDYYVMYSYVTGNLGGVIQSDRRVLASVYRLALRQCENELIRKPITIYRVENVGDETFKILLDKKTKLQLNKLTYFYANKADALKNMENLNPSSKIVLYQLEVNNRAGLVDTSRLGGVRNSVFLLHGEMDFSKISIGQKTIIGDKQIFVATFRYDEMSKEARMVRIVKRLNELYLTDTKFYYNGNEHLPQLLKEKKSSLNPSVETPGTLRGTVLNENFPLTSTQQLKLFKQSSDYKSIFGKNEYLKTFSSFSRFKHVELSGMRYEKKLLQTTRTSLEYLSGYQWVDVQYKLPVNLWCTKTSKALNVDFFINLKGKEFYFNDITLLTNIAPSEIDLAKMASTTEITVRYHLQFDSQYGLIDLASFHEELTNEYAAFPELVYYVKKAKFNNEKRVLDLELVKKPIEKEKWIEIRQREWKLLQAREPIQSNRLEIIEDAAFDISLNVPLHRLRELEKLLKSYILKIDNIANDVPTYGMLAKDISAGITISNTYNDFKITNHIFIDDVLFQNKLHQVDNLASARERINKIFDFTYAQDVSPVFDKYWYSKSIRHYLTFEDYYVIYSRMAGTLRYDIHAIRRFEASLYRLALRQCGDEWIKEPITVYSAGYVPFDHFDPTVGKEGDVEKFSYTNPFFTFDELTIKLAENIDVSTSGKLLIYKVNIRNQAGTVDLGRVYGDVIKQHLLLEETKFINDGLTKEFFGEREYDVLTFHDLETSKESRMVNMVNRLNELFTTETKFYVTDNVLLN